MDPLLRLKSSKVGDDVTSSWWSLRPSVSTSVYFVLLQLARRARGRRAASNGRFSQRPRKRERKKERELAICSTVSPSQTGIDIEDYVGGDHRFGLLLYCFLILDTRDHVGQGNLKLHSFNLPLSYPRSLFRA